jgi:tRNA threonylcarbamoyl adenosine modification protein (Sua5/YciO/YrdC/YwlC family)
MSGTTGDDGAVPVIAEGRVIAFPTDTVFGLGCDPADPDAVERIYRIKGRPAGMELNLLAASREQLSPFVEFNEVADRLAEAWWPGALALVLPLGQSKLSIPRGGSTLMVRVPGDPELLKLLAETGPLASTSANRHGEPAATTADEARATLGDDVDLIIGGASGGSVASTIIDCTAQPPRVLRQGPINADELRAFWETAE